jgi:hypothetical protein
MSKAAELAALIGSQTALSNRNFVINGAMQVAQRSTSVASLSSTATYSTCDRFEVQYGSSGTFTESQSTTAPSGFSNSLKLDCTTADASPNYLVIMHRMEGQNLQQLKKGISAAESTTLSFHVRSSKTGTYQVNLVDNDNTRIIGATYTISSANTWEYKSISFAGDTTGTLNNNNGASLQIEWWLASGSTYNSGAVPTAWEAMANGDRAAGLNVAIGASTSDDFHITGIQLEVGDVATAFEHRSFADELLRCQRYYFQIGPGPDTASAGGAMMTGTNITDGTIVLPVTMRTVPTGITTSGTASDYDCRREGGVSTSTSVPTFKASTENTLQVRYTTTTSQTVGQGSMLRLRTNGFIGTSGTEL